MLDVDALKDAAAGSSRQLPGLNLKHVWTPERDMGFKDMGISYNDGGWYI